MWPMSKFIAWLAVAMGQSSEELYIRSLTMSQAIWDPQSLSNQMIQDNKKSAAKKTSRKEKAREIMERVHGKLKNLNFKEATIDDINKG